MTFLGADVDDLVDHSHRCRSRAGAIEDLRALIDTCISQVEWEGEDADVFREHWSSQVRLGFDDVAQQLRQRAAELVGHADEQDGASDVGSEPTAQRNGATPPPGELRHALGTAPGPLRDLMKPADREPLRAQLHVPDHLVREIMTARVEPPIVERVSGADPEAPTKAAVINAREVNAIAEDQFTAGRLVPIQAAPPRGEWGSIDPVMPPVLHRPERPEVWIDPVMPPVLHRPERPEVLIDPIMPPDPIRRPPRLDAPGHELPVRPDSHLLAVGSRTSDALGGL